MKQIICREKGLRRAQIWFNKKKNFQEIKVDGVDLLEFKESLKPLGSEFNLCWNGVVDLCRSQEEIFKGLTKGFRYEVRRAQKEGLTAVNAMPPNSEILESVFKIYKGFSDSKSLPFIPLNLLRIYREAGNLAVTWAMFSVAGDPLQYHIYFKDSQEAILLASFPGTAKASIENKFFGYANRLLHWEDILQFKHRGISRYNLGGIGNLGSSGNENIRKFKMEMNPNIESYYHAVVPISWQGKLFWFLRDWLKGRE